MKHKAPRRRLRPQLDSRGISLIEICVVLLLLGIILPILYGFLFSVQRNESTVQSRDVATQQAQVIGETLSRQIHAAIVPTGASSAIVTATSNELSFYSALGNANGPTLIDIKTAAGSISGTYNLVETVTQESNGNWTGGTTSILGTGIVPPTANPTTDCPGSLGTPGIFEYFNSGGTCLPLSTSTTPPSLSSASIGSLENLQVNLTALDYLVATSSPTITYTLQITLPNIDYFNETTSTTT